MRILSTCLCTLGHGVGRPNIRELFGILVDFRSLLFGPPNQPGPLSTSEHARPLSPPQFSTDIISAKLRDFGANY